MKGLADVIDDCCGRTQLTLSEVPSFEGELKIRLVRKLRLFGPSQFFLLCGKNFPMNETDFRLVFCLLRIEDRARVAEAKELFRILRWQLRVTDRDITALSQLLEEVPRQKMPARGSVLDGTTCKLSFGRGLRKRKFKWSGDTPTGWEALGRIKEALIRLADVQAKIDSLDWKPKIDLLNQLEQELRELRERQQRQKIEAIERNNETCRRVAEKFHDRGLTCPHCNQSTRIRYVERGPDAVSFFICQQCARSFRASDLPRSSSN